MWPHRALLASDAFQLRSTSQHIHVGADAASGERPCWVQNPLLGDEKGSWEGHAPEGCRHRRKPFTRGRNQQDGHVEKVTETH